MEREEHGGRQADDRGSEMSTDSVVEDSDEAVKEDVDQMVAYWVQTPEGKVPPEREDRQGSVGLVALFSGHRSSPEVVFEEVPERHVGPEVSIVSDGCDVIEDEVAGQGVPVDGDADEEEKRLNEKVSLVDERR